MTNEVVTNEMSCFQVDGGEDGPVEAQSMLPDISDFDHLGRADRDLCLDHHVRNLSVGCCYLESLPYCHDLDLP